VFRDVSGNGRVGQLTAGSVSVGTVAVNGAGGGISIPYVGGTTSTQINWGNASIPSTFTICSITRYSGVLKERILGSSNLNWVHGHWGRAGAPQSAGATYYYTDVNVEHKITPTTNWVVACGRNVAVGSGKVGTIINGVTTSTGMGGKGNCDLSIGTYCTKNTCDGVYEHPETSDWQLSRLYVWDSHLSDDVFAQVSSELNQYLATGNLECTPCLYKEFAFEITATWVTNDDWGGFAELQFYDCTGAQLVPSGWSNPLGNQGGIASHAPALAFDGNLGTKWLDMNKQPLIATFSTAVRVASYRWITAADASNEPGRNPSSWKLKARPLSSDAWQVLSTVVQHSFTRVNNELVGPFSLTL
jgi:hypothetical protein